VDYTESGNFSNDLNNLRSGVIPAALDLRETYSADLVAMLSDAAGACGVGYLMQNLSPAFEASGFSATNYSCAVGNLTFAHELGHNMGCQHDADNASVAPLFSYSYGWRWNATNGQQRRSVMAYSPGIRVPHFSNPDVTNGGTPTGDPVLANNALSINNAALVISNFRVGDCGCPVDVNNSGSIDLADLSAVLNSFGQTTSVGDTDGNGIVDLSDLSAVLNSFGTDCP